MSYQISETSSFPPSLSGSQNFTSYLWGAGAGEGGSLGVVMGEEGAYVPSLPLPPRCYTYTLHPSTFSPILVHVCLLGPPSATLACV